MAFLFENWIRAREKKLHQASSVLSVGDFRLFAPLRAFTLTPASRDPTVHFLDNTGITDDDDAPLHATPSAETAAYAMEMERRPAAARRLMDAPRAPRATPVPACDGELVARMEASRRGKAARRLGLFQTRPGAIDAIDAVSALAPLRLAGEMGAAAEMERRRRPRAAARWARGRHRAPSPQALEQVPQVGISGVSLADTACARMERARRPRAAARAETLRLEKAPRSILHPEHVGAFAMDDAATRDAERAFAEWRSHGGWSAGIEDTHITTGFEQPPLEPLSFEQPPLSVDEAVDKAAASASAAPETDPFAALERALETRLRFPSRGASSPRAGGSGTTSRGGSTRGASAYASAYASAFMHTSRSRSSISGHGSSANLEREGSTLRGNAVPRRVRCSLEDSDVVCRADDGDEIVERVAREDVEAKIAALAETLERERLSAPPPVSR